MATPPPPGPNPYAQPQARPYAQWYPQPQVQPQYPAPAPQPHAPHPGAWPPPGAMGGQPSCQMCGAQPAVVTTVRGHQGFLIIMRFLKVHGAFCRSCGMATYRDMSANTLWQGWWGPLSMIFTPLTLLSNFFTRFSFSRLAPPSGGWRPPLDPGKPIPLRPAGLLVLVPLALLLVGVVGLMGVGLFAGATQDPSRPSATSGPAGPNAERIPLGSCVRNNGDWKEQDLEAVECGSPEAQYRAVDYDSCGPRDFIADARYGADGNSAFCLHPLSRTAR